MTRSATVTQLHQKVDANEISRRRRAINMALNGFMSQAQLLEALWLWEREYAHGSAFEISDYLHTVCASPDLKSRQSEIRRNLIRYMAQPLEELGPDPWPLMRDYSASRSEGSSPSSADTAGTDASLKDILSSRPATGIMLFVINHMLDAMLNNNPAYAARVRQWQIDNLRGWRMARGASELGDWLRNQTRPPAIDYREVDMRKIVNVLYIGACEYFGPNVADVMLHDAIDQAERLPAAKRFAPKELL